MRIRPAWTLAALAVPLGALWVSVRAYRAEAACFHPRRGPVGLPPSGPGEPAFESVRLRGRAGGEVGAWYLPARAGAAVVLVHGSGADRRSMLPEARLLARAGYGLLLPDLPGHGESEGEVRFGVAERGAVQGALDWLAARPGVDPARLGLLGFSMGGYVAAGVAAEDPRVRAVVLVSAPPDAERQTRWEHRRFGFLTEEPALLAVRRAGLPLGEAEPADVVARIAPRAVLIVGGTADPVVPEGMTRELFARAAEPRELLVVEGAGHGGFAELPAGRYASPLLAFLARHLGG